MDTQTRHALKQDKFVDVTASGLEWMGENRSSLLLWSGAAVLAIALIATGIVLHHSRTVAANQLLGQAMDIYDTPIAQPGQMTEPGMKTYPTAAARAKDAYPLFDRAANQYGWLTPGKMARYFAGMTALDMNQTATGEADLEKAAHSGSSGVSALAKLALANEYAQTGRTSQAVALYQELIQHPTTTVPKPAAQLQLAQMYETTQQPQEAKRIYAEIKDQDKATDAAQIATQKLDSLK